MSKAAKETTLEQLQAALKWQTQQNQNKWNLSGQNSTAAPSPAAWLAKRRQQRAEQSAEKSPETARLVEALGDQKAKLHQARGYCEVLRVLIEISHNWLKNCAGKEGQQANIPTIQCGKDPFVQSLKSEAEKAGTPVKFTPFDLEGVRGQQTMIGLSVASAAASETGTLLLTSGNDNPTPLNFLSVCHIILLEEEKIYPTYEAAWQAIMAFNEDGSLQGDQPRAINMISGPSRTADIEQTLTLGAHGPIELHVIIC